MCRLRVFFLISQSLWFVFAFHLSVFLHYTSLSYYWMLPLRLFLKIKYILIFSTALIYSSFYLNHCKIEGFTGNNYMSSWISSYYLFIFVHHWGKKILASMHWHSYLLSLKNVPSCFIEKTWKSVWYSWHAVTWIVFLG